MKSKKITKWESIVIALVLILGFVGYYIWDNCQKVQFQENYGQYTYLHSILSIIFRKTIIPLVHLTMTK